MTPDELIADMERSIAYAIGQFPYQPPRSRDPDERARYYDMVAKAVMKQLAYNWVPEGPDVMRRKPPQKLAVSEWKPGG